MSERMNVTALDEHLNAVMVGLGHPQHHVTLSFEALASELVRARREEAQQKDRIHALEVQQAELIRQNKEQAKELAEWIGINEGWARQVADLRREKTEQAETIKILRAAIQAVRDDGVLMPSRLWAELIEALGRSAA